MSIKNTADAADADVLDVLHGVVHALRALQLRRGQAQEPALTPLEGRALGFFARHPGATLSDLASHSGRDKGQLARLVAGLRDRGLLIASADESDRRSSRLEPSAHGEAAAKRMRSERSKLSRQAVAAFSTAEREQLVALLNRLQEGLERLD